MARIKVPYESVEEMGVTLDLEIPDKNLIASFIPEEPAELPNLAAETAYAVEHPFECAPLSQMLRKGDKVAILIENQFRAAPVTQIISVLLEKIKAAGADACIAIGNGKVPALSQEQIEEKVGKDIVATGISITCNDVSQEDNYVLKGITARGVPVFVLKDVVEADVVIAIATTQATLWGYGGSGMIIPGVTSNETIEMNHQFSLPSECKPGNNECHMQEDKYEAARIAGVDMGIQMIVNNRFEVSYLQAGDYVESHKAAVRAYDKIYRFDASLLGGGPADIVITGTSAPTDHLYFHTGWATVNVDPICKDGGTIIHASPCPGYGGWSGFALMELMAEYLPPAPDKVALAMKAFYSKDRELWAGCIWWKIYEVMTRKNITVVTDAANLEDAEAAGFGATASLEEAFRAAMEKHGPDARVAFVPFGRYSVLDV